jgi:large subunit ribosomal protein L23
MDFSKILIKPVISEKSLRDQPLGRYAFIVPTSVNKNQVHQAVEQLFKVTVLSVRTKKRFGQSKRVGSKRLRKEYPSQKIAMVQLAKDQKIDLMEVKE